MSKHEKKFEKYAIPNLTLVLILCYVVGYIIQVINSSFFSYLTLDPYLILRGQVWRLFTWLIIPPDTLNAQTAFFVLILLFFTYNIGTAMERTLGTYRYNVFIFTGLLFTVVGSFLCMGYVYLFKTTPEIFSYVWTYSMQERGAAQVFNTYYLTLSVFLAFAATYPNAQVLLMFVIPVKVKWMGILDAILMLYLIIVGDIFSKFVIAAALLNFVFFYLRSKNLAYMKPREVKRRAEFKQQIQKNPTISKHKCAICGRTGEEYPELEFRFCSKCNGNYEYCQDHLFTHEHVK